MNRSNLTIYTVGHSNQSIEEFASLLNSVNIELVVDIRSVPYSRYVHHFSRDILKNLLPRYNIKYMYMGNSLGGKSKRKEVIRDGKVDYKLVQKQEWFNSALNELIEIAGSQKLVIMCAEEDPSKCHRNLLVASALKKKEIQIVHIRKDRLDYGNSSLDQFF